MGLGQEVEKKVRIGAWIKITIRMKIRVMIVLELEKTREEGKGQDKIGLDRPKKG